MINKAISYLCGATLMALAASPSMALARDYLAPGVAGVGAQVHRFVLRDPVTNAPMPSARYRLFLKDEKIAGLPPSHGGVIFGVTDSRGRTASVRFPRRIPTAKWILDPIVGEGDNGESFHLVGEGGDGGEAIAKMPYLLDVKGAYLFCGKTGTSGNTYYVQSHRAQTVSLYTAVFGLAAPDYAWCKRAADAIGSLPANAEASEIFRATLAQYASSKDELSADLLEHIGDKLVELAFASRDSRQLDIALGLGKRDDSNSSGSIGYKLIDANWMVERGMAYIEAALETAPDDPNILDSKGWGLFRLGQGEQALAYFDRSMAAFGEVGEDGVSARPVVLTHKGEVLWQLGRREEARLAFAEAAKLAADNAVLAETLARLHVDIEGARPSDVLEPAATQ